MKYNYTITIPYQEVDMDRKMRFYTLENHLLEVAGSVADQCGFGIRALLPYNYSWIITRMQWEINYLPTHGETIRIETWIEQNAHMLSTRDFVLYLVQANGEEKQIGRVKSVWAVLDLQKREIVNVFDLPMFDNCVHDEKLDLPRGKRMTPITEPDGQVARTVVYSDMDYNGHCNSCKYLEMMLDARFPQFISDDRAAGKETAIGFEISYAKEVGLGEEVQILYQEEADEIHYQIKTNDGMTSCSARINKITE